MAKITNQSTLTSKYTLPDQSEQQNETQSNISTAENMTTSFLKERKSAKDFGVPEAEIMQTITLTNNSEYPISDITVVDTISEGGTFKAGSVLIDDVAQPDMDITTGVQLESDIQPNSSCKIEYYLVLSDQPTQNEVTATSEITYTVNEAVGLKELTNETTISVENEKITIKKTSDKSAVITGDKITYQHEIKNEGNIDNTDLFFKDTIPAETTFVTGSVKIDEQSYPDYDPSVGFSLADLAANQTIIVKFEVTVN